MLNTLGKGKAGKVISGACYAICGGKLPQDKADRANLNHNLSQCTTVHEKANKVINRQ